MPTYLKVFDSITKQLWKWEFSYLLQWGELKLMMEMLWSVDISLQCTILLTTVYFQYQIFAKSKISVSLSYSITIIILVTLPVLLNLEVASKSPKPAVCFYFYLILFWFISEGPQILSGRLGSGPSQDITWSLARVRTFRLLAWNCGPSRVITWP